MNGQVFTLDDEPCTRCTCQLGEVSCERIPCQWACADPTLLFGDCCSSCPEFLLAAEERQGPAPLGRLELGKAARSPRGDATAPVNCSSCPGPPPAPPARPALPLLQLLLGTNVSDTQTSRAESSGAPASTSPSPGPGPGPEGTSPGEPGDSQPPALSPGASTPPPAPPGAPWPPPVTPEGPVSASGTRTAARRPTTLLAEASALSTPHSGPSETSTLPLRPRRPARPASRLPAAPAAARARSRQHPEETPNDGEAIL